MTRLEVRKQALALGVRDRVDLAMELWDSLGQDTPVPQWHRDLIDERLTELEGQDPEHRSAPWAEVRERVFRRDE